jgi:hypothetical protein
LLAQAYSLGTLLAQAYRTGTLTQAYQTGTLAQAYRASLQNSSFSYPVTDAPASLA